MHFCSAEVFFLLSVLVWNENNGAFGQGKHTKCLFSLKVAFLSRLLTSEHFHRKLTPSLLDFSALVNEPRDSSQMTENSLNYTLVSRQIREESRCGKSVFFWREQKRRLLYRIKQISHGKCYIVHTFLKVFDLLPRMWSPGTRFSKVRVTYRVR